jgi:isopentenyl diphosphate isomerase/L-lactate dehydrogenase-like FMN-dependent dehydrogenase
MSQSRLTRRCAVQSFLGLPGLSLCAQTSAGENSGSIPPVADLVNVLEMLPVARRRLPVDVYATVSGTDRRTLERITFRPRMMVNVTQLDLSLEFLGEQLFAPILVGPMSYQQTFHPEGELAVARGASAAKTGMFVSSRSSRKLPEIIAAANTPVWFQAYPNPDINVTIAAAREAVEAGCRGVCLTVGVPYEAREAAVEGSKSATGNLKLDWAMIERVRKSVKKPLLLKGIMHPEEAQLAVSRGVDAIVVSNHAGMFLTGFADPTEMLPLVVEAVGGKIPVLVDGSYRRGTDILKALALGARAVLLGRPPVWGLAAYGAPGVQRVLEMLQTELARNMALCGKPDLKSVDRTLIKIHSR